MQAVLCGLSNSGKRWDHPSLLPEIKLIFVLALDFKGVCIAPKVSTFNYSSSTNRTTEMWALKILPVNPDIISAWIENLSYKIWIKEYRNVFRKDHHLILSSNTWIEVVIWLGRSKNFNFIIPNSNRSLWSTLVSLVTLCQRKADNWVLSLLIVLQSFIGVGL